MSDRGAGVAVGLAVVIVLGSVTGVTAVPGNRGEDGRARAAGTAAETLVVDEDGGDYDSIQAAVNAADAGDVVEVRAGTYNESVVVNESVTLRGPEATLDGTGQTNTSGMVITSEGAGATVAGLAIRGFDYDGVLLVGDVGEARLDGITAEDNGQSGVDAFRTGGDWVIDGATLRGNGIDGLSVTNATGRWRLADATVTDNADDGIDVFNDTASWTVVGTNVTGNGENGIEAIGTTDDWVVFGGSLSGNADDGIDVAGASGDWALASPRIVGNGENGIEATGTTGAWTVAGARVRDSGRYGITTDRSVGNWTVRDTVVEGNATALRVRNTTGAWTARNLTTADAAFGVDAIDASGNWSIERFRARGVRIGIRANDADGEWRVRDATIDAALGGLAAFESDGAWTARNLTVVNATAVGVFAVRADGPWTLVDANVTGAVAGLSARRTGGNWTVRSSAFRNYTTGIDATNSTGAWDVERSVLATTRANSTDVIGGERGPTGDATRNWWGGTVAVPDAPDCEGNVDCSEPLDRPPGPEPRNISASASDVETPPGTATRIEFSLAATDAPLASAGLQIESGPPLDDGWEILRYDSTRGRWDETTRTLTISDLTADEPATAAVTVRVPNGTAPGTYRIAATPQYTLDGTRYTAPRVTAVVRVTNGTSPTGPIQVEISEARVRPGRRALVNLTVRNPGTESIANPTVAVDQDGLPVGADVRVGGTIAPTGSWRYDLGEYEWSIDALAPGATATPSFYVEADSEENLDSGFGPREIGIDAYLGGEGGELISRQNATVTIVRPPPPPNLTVTARAGSSLIGGEPGVAYPGEEIPVTFAVTNRDENATDATFILQRTGGFGDGWPVANYTADTGRWLRNQSLWTVSDLQPGETATLRVDIAVPAGQKDGYWSVGGELKAGGEEIDDARTELQVPDENGPNRAPVAAVKAPDRRIYGRTVYLSPDGSVTLDGSPSYDVDGSIETYEWDVDGDGTTDETGPTITEQFVEPGQYDVTLTVSDGELTDSTTILVRVGDGAPPGGSPPENFPPIPSFSIEPTDPVPGDSVTLDASATRDADSDRLTYAWDLDDDGTIDREGSDLQQVTIDVEEVGERTVTLVVTDSAGGRSPLTRTITVADPDAVPTASFAVERVAPLPADGTIRVGDRVGFDGTGSTAPDGRRIAEYEWSFGDGRTATGATAEHTFGDAGTYDVTLRVTDTAGRTDTVTRSVRVDPPAGPTITDVEALLPGPMIQDIGMENEYTVSVQSETPVERVVLTFPGGTRVRAEPVDGSQGAWRTDPIAADDLAVADNELVRITAVDAESERTVYQWPIDVVEAPSWLGRLFQASVRDRNDAGRYVIRGRNFANYPFGTSVRISPPNADYAWTNKIVAKGSYTPRTRRFEFENKRTRTFSITRDGLLTEGNTRQSNDVSGTFGGGASAGLSGTARVDLDGENGIVLSDDARYQEAIRVNGEVGVTAEGNRVDGTVTVGVKGDLGKRFDVTTSGSGELELAPSDPDARNLFAKVSDYAIFGGEVTGPPEEICRVGLGVGGQTDFEFDAVLETDGGGQRLVVTDGKVVKKLVAQATASVIQKKFTLLDVSEPIVSDDITLVSRDATITDGTRGLRTAASTARVGRLCSPNPPGPGGSWRPIPPIGLSPPALVAIAVGAGAVVATVTVVTADELADDHPDLGGGGEDTTVTWSAQDRDKDALNGRDIVVTTRRNGGGFGVERRVTDDDRLDVAPEIATTDDRETVAWVRARSRLDEDGIETLDDLTGEYEIAVATRSTGDWSSPRILTDNDVPDLDPVVATAASGTTILAWTRDTDGDMSTRADREVRYVLLDGRETVGAGRLVGRTVRDVTPTPDGYTITGISLGGAGDDVYSQRITSDGDTQRPKTSSFSRVSSVAAIPNGFVTLEQAATGASGTVHLRQGPYVPPTRASVSPSGLNALDDLDAIETGGRVVVTYSAVPDGGNQSRPYYQVYAGDSGWTAPQALAKGNVSVERLDTAATEDGFITTVAAAGSPAQRTDVFTLEHDFDADVSVSAAPTVAGIAGESSVSTAATATTSAEGPGIGTPTRVNYTIRNRGDIPAGPRIVLVSNASGVIAAETVRPLPVGGSVSGVIEVPVDRSGEVEVRVVSTDRNRSRDLDPSNDNATAILARPDVRVLGVEDRFVDGRLRLWIRLANDGPVPVGNVSYRVRVGDRNVTGTVSGIGANGTWTTTAELNVSGDGLDDDPTAVVALDPADRVDESDETNNRFTGGILRADVGVEGTTAVYRDRQGARAEFAIRNSDTGAATANVTVTTPGGSRTYRIELPGSRGPDDAVFRFVSLAVPDVGPGENLTVTAGSRRVDADPTDNAVQRTVGSVEPAVNASVDPLSIESAGLRRADGGTVLDLAVRNSGNRTTGEVVTVSRGATVLDSEPVAVGPGERAVSLRVNVTGSGNYTVATANDTATVRIEGACPLNATDPDGDGRCEDVNGDGELAPGDATVLFNAVFEGEPVVLDNPGAFDFSGDGEVTAGDATVLFEEAFAV